MGFSMMPETNQWDVYPLVKTKLLGGVPRIPISSESSVSFIKIQPMFLLVSPMRIVGTLVTLDMNCMLSIGKTESFLAPPGILFSMDSMSMGLLVLENREERETNWLVGLLAA